MPSAGNFRGAPLNINFQTIISGAVGSSLAAPFSSSPLSFPIHTTLFWFSLKIINFYGYSNCVRERRELFQATTEAATQFIENGHPISWRHGWWEIPIRSFIIVASFFLSFSSTYSNHPGFSFTIALYSIQWSAINNRSLILKCKVKVFNGDRRLYGFAWFRQDREMLLYRVHFSIKKMVANWFEFEIQKQRHFVNGVFFFYNKNKSILLSQERGFEWFTYYRKRFIFISPRGGILTYKDSKERGWRQLEAIIITYKEFCLSLSLSLSLFICVYTQI